MACQKCGQRNRLHYERLGETFRCGKCQTPLLGVSQPIDVATDEQFTAVTTRASIPVLVDFWASWCGPCKWISPTVAEQARDLAGKVKVVKLDIDNNPQTPIKYGIRGVPTLLVFKGGAVVDTLVGNPGSKAKVVELLGRHM